MMGLPEKEILTAHGCGRDVLKRAGLVAESPDVALQVEHHRWFWKPKEVKVILIAESHVYTSEPDLRIKLRKTLLPNEMSFSPDSFVRLVYCLGYGENQLLERKPEITNRGTWQYWNLF